MNGYQLTRKWFDFAFDNKEAKSHHTALYCWCVELNNRLGWKQEFGLPTIATMEGLSIGNKNTFLDALKDLVKWKFIEVIQESKNQNSSRIIRLCHSENATALYTALDSAIIQQCNSTDADTVPIVKQLNQETIKPLNIKKAKSEFIAPTFEEVKSFFLEHKESLDLLDKCFYYYSDANWTNRDGKKVKDWKRTIKTNWFGKNKKEASTFIPAESRPIRVHESYQTNL